MKRVISIILTLALFAICTSATASGMSDKYDEALELIMQNKYREAAAILDEISIYNDASQLSLYCKSIAEGSEGKYSVAYRMLDELGEYKDSKIWSIYFKACEAQEKGDDMLAYELFSSISLFRDSAERMQGVETGKNSDFKKEYSIDCNSIGEGLIVVKKDDKCGYADIHGNIVLDLQWEDAEPFQNGLAIVKHGFGTSYVIDHNGRNVIGSYWHGLIREGDFFITLDYDYSAQKVCLGLIDNKGTVIFKAKYDGIDVLTPSCVAVKLNDKYGLYNMLGEELLGIQYDEFRSISNSLIAVKKGEKYALYSSEGKAISEFVYDSVGYGSGNLVSVSAEGKEGFVDLDGNVVIELIYDKTYSISEGLIKAEIDGYIGCIDTKGNVVIPFEYEAMGFFDDGKVEAKKDGKWGLIDSSNRVLIPFEYDEFGFSKEGIAAAKKGEKYGFVDEAGNTVIEFRWDNVSSFSEGKAFVSDGSGQYCINIAGEKIFDVPNAISLYSPFKGGIAIIYHESEEKNAYDRSYRKYGVIDNTGVVLIAPEYDSIRPMGTDFYLIRKGGYSDGKVGLLNSQGEMLFDAKYISISPFDDEGYSLVVGDTTWFIIDTEGNIVF